MALTVEEYDTRDDDIVREVWAVLNAVTTHDQPDRPPMPLAYYQHAVRIAGDDFRMARFVARRDGAVVGMAGAHLSLVDNTHVADVLVRVHPEARRQGVGRALLDVTLAAARAGGRRVAIGATRSAVPGGVPCPGDGAPFAAAVGAHPALRSMIRRLDLAEADLSGLDEARAASAGYSVIAWAGQTPDVYLAGIAALAARINTDAPTGDLDLTDDSADPEHYRVNERRQEESGYRAYTTAARHDASGEIVAYTRLLVVPHSDHADQLGTLVDTHHRGHRLGVLTKIENLIRVRDAEPALRWILTQNANENAHMVAINEALGFRPHSADIAWQLTL